MINHDNHFPPLETDRLYLRSLTLADLEFVFQHFSDPTVTQYMLDEPPLTELAQAQELIEFYQDPLGKPYNRWGLERKEDGHLIGTCGYHNWRPRYFRAEIGYDLNPASWGQGYMTEALRTVLQHGFERIGLNRIEALVYPENVRSLRLLQKLGFQSEGILRDYFCLDGQFYDHTLLSLLRRAWRG
jgi:ribosomal-protein-alanine N-acetyltransferase